MGRKLNRKRRSALLDEPTEKMESVEHVVPKIDTIDNPVVPKDATFEKQLKDSNQDEFLEFLKSEDPEILDTFQAGEMELSEDENEELEVDHLSEEGSDFDAMSDDVDENTDGSKNVTIEKVNNWAEQLDNGDSRGLLPIAQSLYASIIAVDDRAITDKENKNNEKMANKMISSANMFPHICDTVIKKVPQFLLKAFNIQSTSKAGNLSQHPMWQKCKKGLKILLPGLILLLERLLNIETQKQLMTAMRIMTVFFISLPGQRKSLLKAVSVTWAQSNEILRVQAFLIIHKLMKARPELLDAGLRSLYLNYVANSKFVTPSTLPNVYFMQKCLIELYRLNSNIAYQHGFLYIRQLAIHLRKSLTTVSTETLNSISNWQFVSALQVWSKIIGSQEELADLQLPATQIIFGVLELISGSPRLSPLTFHMLRSCLLLCGSEMPFVPLWMPILEILNHISITKGSRKSQVILEEDIKNQLPDLQMVVRLQSSHCRHKQLADMMLAEFEEICLTYGTALSHKIDFPELTLLPRKRLKEFGKKTQNIEHRRLIRSLLTSLDQNADYIKNKRDRVTFGPTDFAKIAEWEMESLSTGTPLYDKLQDFRKSRQKSRMSNLQRQHVSEIRGQDKPIASFNRFMDTEAGIAQRQEDKEEFPDLFENDGNESEDEPNMEVEPELVTHDEPPLKISKRERKELKIKGKKDKVEDLDIDNW